MKFFKEYFELIGKKISSLDEELLINISDKLKSVSKNNKKVIIAGNGGSAAMASHVSVDLTKAAKIRSINFNEADLLTCFSNDYGYEHVFEKALEFYGDKGDLAILISSSGQSKNMVNAGLKARDLEMGLVTLSGFSKNNPLKQIGDINLWVDSKAYNIVEMTHHIWLLSIADFIIGDIHYSAS